MQEHPFAEALRVIVLIALGSSFAVLVIYSLSRNINIAMLTTALAIVLIPAASRALSMFKRLSAQQRRKALWARAHSRYQALYAAAAGIVGPSRNWAHSTVAPALQPMLMHIKGAVASHTYAFLVYLADKARALSKLATRMATRVSPELGTTPHVMTKIRSLQSEISDIGSELAPLEKLPAAEQRQATHMVLPELISLECEVLKLKAELLAPVDDDVKAQS